MSDSNFIVGNVFVDFNTYVFRGGQKYLSN